MKTSVCNAWYGGRKYLNKNICDIFSSERKLGDKGFCFLIFCEL